MERAADSAWRGIARQAWRDLQPFDGRFAMTWRVALLCALVAGTAMLYKIPEAAISCYLIIFLARPNGAECVGQGIGLILLASIVVFAMAPLIQATADYPLLRMLVIAVTSIAFVFLGAASQLGEIGSIIALVIAFILTLVDQLPVGEIATRGLLYAWQMAVMPMAWMIVFNLVLGTSPHRLLRATVSERLAGAADALETRDPQARHRLSELLAEGGAETDKRQMLARIFHTAPSAVSNWLAGAIDGTYRLMLAVAALPAKVDPSERTVLAGACRQAASAVSDGERPEALPPAAADAGTSRADPALIAVRGLIDGLSQANGGVDAKPAKQPFLAPDAFSNPDYQRYALKTTGAAISCYLIYSLINWQGIHTAMVTCYVAALGTTAETVHKLALRIVGCLIGAAIGLASILFVIPHLTSVGGLMVLVFAGVMVGAWVSSGSERISYAGVQIGLAFLLTILNGFGPSLDMGAARDRVIGILLGNLVVYLFFTQFWPKSAAADVRARLARALAALSRMAALEPSARRVSTGEAALVETESARAAEQIALLPFEPPRERPSAAETARLRHLAIEMRAMLPVLMFAPERHDEPARQLGEAARELDRAARGGKADMAQGSAPPAEDAAGDGVGLRVRRIEQLVAGKA